MYHGVLIKRTAFSQFFQGKTVVLDEDFFYFPINKYNCRHFLSSNVSTTPAKVKYVPTRKFPLKFMDVDSRFRRGYPWPMHLQITKPLRLTCILRSACKRDCWRSCKKTLGQQLHWPDREFSLHKRTISFLHDHHVRLVVC